MKRTPRVTKPVNVPRRPATPVPPRMHPLKAEQQRKMAEKLAKMIHKEFGLKPAGLDPGAIGPDDWISTGFDAIDDALSGMRDKDNEVIEGSGRGFPRGRIIEIYGPESASKTSLALAVVAQAQRQGEHCAFVDVEHALDLHYAKETMNVDTRPEMFTHYQPETGNQALGILRAAVELGMKVIVVDSVAALVSVEELAGGKALGEQARLMSKTCRQLTSYLKPGGPLIIFINQIRYKIGVAFGNPEFTSGGNALKFYASVRIEVRRKKELKKPSKKDKGNPVNIGIRVGLRVKKNKVAPEGGKCLYDLHFGKGITVPKFRNRKQASDPFVPASDNDTESEEADT